MDRNAVKALLEEVQSGSRSIDEAVERLRVLPFQTLEFARLDSHRALRTGFPEVVLCSGKTADQVAHIVERLAKLSSQVLATRATSDVYETVLNSVPAAHYHPTARAITVGDAPTPTGGLVLVVTGGTSDVPVAEEAALTARMIGRPVETLFDVGVAGLHRLIHHAELLQKARVVVAVAGMEGALPSVVAGMVDCPVIAVPTSVGYGAHLGGLAPLLAMLNSCAAGVSVVNIDNGFGAGYTAALIANRA